MKRARHVPARGCTSSSEEEEEDNADDYGPDAVAHKREPRIPLKKKKEEEREEEKEDDEESEEDNEDEDERKEEEDESEEEGRGDEQEEEEEEDESEQEEEEEEKDSWDESEEEGWGESEGGGASSSTATFAVDAELDDDQEAVAAPPPPPDPKKIAKAEAEYFAYKASLIPKKLTKKKKKPYKIRPRRSPAQEAETRKEYLANKSEVAALEYIVWDDETSRYCTTITIPGKKAAICPVSLKEAREASRLAVALGAARGTCTIPTRRKRKADQLARLAPKRAADVATYGNNSAMERKELLRLRTLLEPHGILLHILPDGCRADALYRTDDMGENEWLQKQLKTTEKPYERRFRDKRNGIWYTKRGYVFSAIKGYSGMLVVCRCLSDGKIWAIPGDILEKSKNKKQLVITISSITGKILDVPCCRTKDTRPINDEKLIARLHSECAKVVAGKTDVTTTTVDDAEAQLGKNYAVERAGILAYIEHVLGGALPWDGKPETLLRRPTRFGKFFSYPEEQNGKTDLIVHDKDESRYDTHQFKTPERNGNQTGWLVILTTAVGTDEDGTQLYANMYKIGDNSFYIIVLPPEATHGFENEVHFWCIPEAVMLEHTLIGLGALEGFTVHMPNVLQEERGGVAEGGTKYDWTKAFHTCYCC